MKTLLSRRWLRAVILAWATSSLFAAGPVAQGPEPPERPNLVLIVADDWGHNDLGIIGAKPVLTPNLDRLAREGVRFTQVVTTWYSCVPSMASMLTGRYPQRHGLCADLRNDVVNFGYQYSQAEYDVSPEMYLGLDPREITIGNVLQTAGYRTAAIGKWEMGQARRFLPLQRGFDYFYGVGNNGIDSYTHERYGIPSMFKGNSRTTEDKGTHAVELFKREGLRFIAENRRRPFFLYLPIGGPRGPSAFKSSGLQVPDEYRRLYPQMDPKASLTAYFALISYIDAAIGEVMAALREHGIDDQTLVMFTSDNGGARGNEPLRGGKNALWEGGVRVPFLARWPNHLPTGRVSDDFMSGMDLFPTLLAAAGARPPDGLVLDGYDMLPVLQGKQKSPRTDMYWNIRGDWVARVGNWKLIHYSGEPNGMKERARGLYDLAHDPGETNDLTAKRPDMVAWLTRHYLAWEQQMDAAEPRGPFRNY